MEKIKLNRQELKFIIEMNLDPYMTNEILFEGVFDKLANKVDNFKVKIQKCDLTRLDPRFTGLFFSSDPRAPRVFSKILERIESFVSAPSFLGWRNILEFFYSIAKKLGLIAVGSGMVIFEVVKKVFSLLKIGLLPPLSPICDYLTEMSRLFGEVFESLTNTIEGLIPDTPDFLKKIEEYLDSLPIFF